MLRRSLMIICLCTLSAGPVIAADQPAQPPIARKIPQKLSAHGETRVDNYYWMRDDSREDPDILSHLDAENRYTSAALANIAPLRQTIFKEISDRLQVDERSVPVLDNGYWYYTRYSGDAQFPLHLRRRDAADAREELILDSNQLAAGSDYFYLGDYDISPDNRLMAYTTDYQGRERYQVRFRDLTTGELLEDVLEGSNGTVVWANDNATVFYITYDPVNLRSRYVYQHRLGRPQHEDNQVYDEPDSSFEPELRKSRDNTDLFIDHINTLTKTVSVIDLERQDGLVRPLLPRETGVEYRVARLGDDYYIRTNWQAANFRLMKVSRQKVADRSAWRELIPHRSAVLLKDFTLFDGFLVVVEAEAAQSRLRIVNLKDGSELVPHFDDPLHGVSLRQNPSPASDRVRIYYGSLTTPDTSYDVDLTSGALTLLKRDEVAGDFDSGNYQSRRIFIEARDGEQVPVSLLWRKDLFRKDGHNPLYLYGYGAYGDALEPWFSSSILSLVDRGFVYGIAHVRGGLELGVRWYADGRLLRKKNTFTDFIDVTRGLVELEYADPVRVFASGASAGGLLIGAVVNMAPQLYAGAAAHVPFVDVVTTMADATIPLTSTEYDEWGNPARESDYRYMLSYSPYDQVKAQAYPNLLVTTGLHDRRVQYFEPMKWVAKLRELKTDDKLLIFDAEMKSGHSGASGRYDSYQVTALEYAFFLSLSGYGAEEGNPAPH